MGTRRGRDQIGARRHRDRDHAERDQEKERAHRAECIRSRRSADGLMRLYTQHPPTLTRQVVPVNVPYCMCHHARLVPSVTRK